MLSKSSTSVVARRESKAIAIHEAAGRHQQGIKGDVKGSQSKPPS